MRRFKSLGHAQRFLAAHGPIACYFRPHRHQHSGPGLSDELPVPQRTFALQ